jgi:hypothetical protein
MKRNFLTSRYSLCISYDNLAICDGAGAQIQRIVEIYGVCRLYNYQFSNVDILKIDSNPGDGMNTEAEKNKFIFLLNDIFVRPLSNCNHDIHTDVKTIWNFLVNRLNFPRIWLRINQFVNIGKNNSRLVLSDLSFTKKLDSDLYFFYKNKIHSTEKFIKWVKLDKAPEIQIHFQGAKTSRQRMAERYIEPKKLIELLQKIKNNYPEYQTLLHTDLDMKNENWNVVDSQTPETIRYWQESGLIDKNNKVVLNKIDPRSIFSESEIDQVLTAVSPLDVWKQMANADILICAKSSLSFIGALINIKPSVQIYVPNGFINYPTNWNKVNF